MYRDAPKVLGGGHSRDDILHIILELEELLAAPKVMGLGEVGLDFTGTGVTDQVIRQQQWALEQCLPLATKFSIPVVIHCRDEDGGQDAAYRCLEIMKRSLPPHQPVHLHCFHGDMQLYHAFLSAFPNLVIGVTSRMVQDNERVIRQIPLYRIVLETDAPYQLPTFFKDLARYSNPGMILESARAVALAKNLPMTLVCNMTRAVSKSFYKL